MKATVMRPVEIEIHAIKLDLAVRYEEEDIPNDFPLRDGEMWSATIEIDTGKILNWPSKPRFQECCLEMKVCDEGSYTLLDKEGHTITARINEYVPHGVVPGECGDYVKLAIKNGVVTNWPKKPNVEVFFGADEE